jgi:hypothetical protein
MKKFTADRNGIPKFFTEKPFSGIKQLQKRREMGGGTFQARRIEYCIDFHFQR